jgi:hypothetical protein
MLKIRENIKNSAQKIEKYLESSRTWENLVEFRILPSIPGGLAPVTVFSFMKLEIPPVAEFDIKISLSLSFCLFCLFV